MGGSSRSKVGTIGARYLAGCTVLLLASCSSPEPNGSIPIRSGDAFVADTLSAGLSQRTADSLYSIAIHNLESDRDTIGTVSLFRRAAQLYSIPAIARYDRALSCYGSICSMTNRTIYNDTAYVYAMLADLVIRRYKPDLDDTTAWYIYRQIASPLADSDERDKGKAYAIMALDHANLTGDRVRIDRAVHDLAEVQKQTGHFEEAISLDLRFIGSTQQRLGNELRHNPSALRQLDQAHSNIADAYKQVGNLDCAIVHLRKAYGYAKQWSPARSWAWTDCEINLANTFVFMGFAGVPAAYDSAVTYCKLAKQNMAQADAALHSRLDLTEAFLSMAHQAMGDNGTALALATDTSRPWLVERRNGIGSMGNTTNQLDMEALDAWTCVVENMFTEFADSMAYPWAISLNDEIFRRIRSAMGDIDPTSLGREYQERTFHNNRHLNFLWLGRGQGEDWTRLAFLFEARKGDQLRNWYGTLGQGPHAKAQRAAYQKLMGERAIVAAQGDAAPLGELARLTAKVDSVRYLLKIDLSDTLTPDDAGLLHRTLAALDDSTLLMNYAWSEDMNGARLHILALSNSERWFTQRQLHPWLDSALVSHVASVKKGSGSYSTSTARLLADSLLPPSVALGRYKRLIVLPEGRLNELPFESLALDAGGQTRPLLEFVSVRYEYGMGFLQRPASDNDAIEMLACAPEFMTNPGSAFAPARRTRSLLSVSSEHLRHGFEPLTENVAEAMVLSSDHGATSILGTEANETRLTRELPSFGVLHFATHAVCSDSIPELSGIILSGALEHGTGADSLRSGEMDGAADDILHAYEIRSMQLKANMAVLSACETGIGKEARGEGAMSLARAFRFAGVPNVVSSLWKVDDRATKEIMVKFYEKLADGMGKADALAEAKRWYRKEHPDAPPSKWAAFILIGDNEPVKLKKRSPVRPWMWGGAAVVLIAGIAMRRRRGSKLAA